MPASGVGTDLKASVKDATFAKFDKLQVSRSENIAVTVKFQLLFGRRGRPAGGCLYVAFCAGFQASQILGGDRCRRFSQAEARSQESMHCFAV